MHTKAVGFYFSRVAHSSTYLPLGEKKIVLFFPRAGKKNQDRFSEFFPFFFFPRSVFFSLKRSWGPTSKKILVLFFPRARKKKNQDRFSGFFPVFFPHDRFFFSSKDHRDLPPKKSCWFFFSNLSGRKKKTGPTYLFLRKRPKYDLLPRKKKTNCL